MHYTPEESVRRFWENVDQTNQCWLWLGARTHHPTHSYGVLIRDNRRRRAHRFAWELENGPVPQGFLVCHSCDTPLCVRVEHLFLGTNRDNTQDMLAKDRHGKRRVHGSSHHKAVLTEASVSQLRRERAAGSSLSSLAEKYGVSKGLVWQISVGRIWKHVD